MLLFWRRADRLLCKRTIWQLKKPKLTVDGAFAGPRLDRRGEGQGRNEGSTVLYASTSMTYCISVRILPSRFSILIINIPAARDRKSYDRQCCHSRLSRIYTRPTPPCPPLVVAEASATQAVDKPPSTLQTGGASRDTRPAPSYSPSSIPPWRPSLQPPQPAQLQQNSREDRCLPARTIGKPCNASQRPRF